MVTSGPAPHLGGFVAGGDPATVFPDLWKYLVEEERIGSVLDVGCGDGTALDYFAMLGCDVLGIDGVPFPDDARIVEHDFTTGPYHPASPWGLVWCCEFVEHVEEQYAKNFLQTFVEAEPKLLLMTHAAPGQAGYHHVNCQDGDYWKRRVEAVGFRYDPMTTAATRSIASLNPDPWNHFLRSGLAFRRAT